MIGIIVTGHGNFATGLTSGLKLLAGEPENYAAVDFAPEDSIEILSQHLTEAVESLGGCEAITVFTDLTGGSPFNVASRLKQEAGRGLIEVAGGTSLPVVLNAYMTRSVITDAALLMDQSLAAGKEQMVRVQPLADNTDDDCECEEYEEE